MHQKFGKNRTCSYEDILAERQTERYTDILITIRAPLTGVYKAMNASIGITCFRQPHGPLLTFQHEFLNFGIFAYNSQQLNSLLSLYYLNLSPINVK